MTDKIHLYLYLQRECRGREAARRVNTIAADLDIPSRVVQALAYELALETGCVGSATSGPAGLYWITCYEDAVQAEEQLTHRIQKISPRAAAIRRKWGSDAQKQLAL